jgi:polar amino acid transport system substrate-binding protein
MVSRRELAGQITFGAAAAALLGASPAQAQTAAQSTFDRIMSTKKLRVGAVAAGAPWWVKDQATGQWGGQFWDISSALAADMEVQLELVETSWGNAILDLQANKTDIMFGLNPTPKRALAVDFSGPVYNSGLVVIGKPGFEPKKWVDMNKPEVKISVDVGSAHDQIASRLCPQAQIVRFKSIDEATLALRSGRVDAQCIFWQGAVRAVKRDSAIGKVIVPQPLFGSTSNAAVRREADKTWRDFVNTWIVYAQGLGLIRTAVISSLEKVDITLADIPEGITF